MGGKRVNSSRFSTTSPAESAVALPPIRTEGQRMLLHVTGSLSAIANECGAKAQSVFEWRNGTKRPSMEARIRIQAVFGIPIDAWAMMSTDTPQAKEALAVVEDPSKPLPSTLDECMALLAVIKRDRMTAGLLPGERVRLSDAEARILKLRSELEQRAELTEDRYVRDHPAWLRARKAISQALLQFPEAARAVAEALEKVNL